MITGLSACNMLAGLYVLIPGQFGEVLVIQRIANF